MTYTFYITDSVSVETEVHPLNENPVTDFLDATAKGWTVYTIIQQSTCSC